MKSVLRKKAAIAFVVVIAILAAGGRAAGTTASAATAQPATGQRSLTQPTGRPTTTTLTSANPTSVSGQTVQLTATVTCATTIANEPAGLVQLFDNGNPIDSQPTNGANPGLARFSQAFTSGTHALLAQYAGNANCASSTGRFTQTVNAAAPAASTISLAGSVNPSVYGQSVSFTATVTCSGGAPTGQVFFRREPYAPFTHLGSAPFDGQNPGHATFSTTALEVGTHDIRAIYAGDGVNCGASPESNSVPQVVNKADTLTTVTSSANPIGANQPITWTATVSTLAPGAGTPTGTINWSISGSAAGPCTLVNGSCTFAQGAEAAGTYILRAAYAGDGNFNSSTGQLTQQVNAGGQNPAASTTTVVSTLNPSTVNAIVTFTATVAPSTPGTGTPTGSVTFLDYGNNQSGTPATLGGGTLSGNPAMASFSTSGLTAGTHIIRAQYNADANFAGSLSANLNQQVTAVSTLHASTTTVTSSLNPSVYQQSVTFTATVSCGTFQPTGSVLFLADFGTPLGNAQLQTATTPPYATTATVATSTLAVGSHSISALYGGDSNCGGSQGSLATNQVVNDAGSSAQGTTQVALLTFRTTASGQLETIAPGGTVAPGQLVTIAAGVTCSSRAALPAGSVTFLDTDGSVIVGTPGNPATVTASGLAYIQTSSLAPGSHTITALWIPTSTPSTCPATSASTAVQIVADATTTTMLTSAYNPAPVGAAVTFTARVTCTAGSPTGTVAFQEARQNLAGSTANPAEVFSFSGASSGAATFTTSSLGAGNHGVTATYSGDGTCAVSTSDQLVERVVQPVQTTIDVTVSANPATVGEPLKLTAYVACPGATATGTISFQADLGPMRGDTANPAQIGSDGAATFTTSELTAGTHDIIAIYNGDANCAPTESFDYILSVQNPVPCHDTVLTVAPSDHAPTSSTVHMTARTQGCSNPEFYFYVIDANGALPFERPYAALAAADWHADRNSTGSYTIVVGVRRSGSSALDDLVSQPYTIAQSCTVVSLTADPSATLRVGDAARFTASPATGCANPEYRFTSHYSGNNTNDSTPPPGCSGAPSSDGGYTYGLYTYQGGGCDQIIQDWSSSATAPWDTTQLDTVDYAIMVEVRAAGADGVDSTANLGMSLFGCGGTTLEVDPRSPSQFGATVHLQANTSSCGASPEYRFYIRDPQASGDAGGAATQLFSGAVLTSDWSSTPTFVWHTPPYYGSGNSSYSFQIFVTARPGGTHPSSFSIEGASASADYELVNPQKLTLQYGVVGCGNFTVTALDDPDQAVPFTREGGQSSQFRPGGRAAITAVDGVPGQCFGTGQGTHFTHWEYGSPCNGSTARTCYVVLSQSGIVVRAYFADTAIATMPNPPPPPPPATKPTPGDFAPEEPK